MAKYIKEEKQKATDLCIRYCNQATMVLWNLGILMSGTHWPDGTEYMNSKVKLRIRDERRRSSPMSTQRIKSMEQFVFP